MVNIFEGARRIALLLGIGAAVVTVLVAFNEDAYYHAQYSLAAPNAPFKKNDGDCQGEGRTMYFDHKTSSGKEVRVSICLETMTFKNNNGEESELIPYKIDADGMTWGASTYSTEISNYETQVQERFTMTVTDELDSIEDAEKKWRTDFAETMGYLVVSLAVFGAFVMAIGWIVRGFLGIPRGMDKRPDL